MIRISIQSALGSSVRFVVLVSAALIGTLAASHEERHSGNAASALESGAGVQRSLARYEVPDITLVRQDGQPVRLRRQLSGPGPVYLDFIFTTCTTVCPVMSQVFHELQSKLAATGGGDGVTLLSISLDPLQDTPQRLGAYARQFGAGPNWHFLTGTAQASAAAQRAFDVYRPDKMNHPVASFFRAGPDRPWVRLDGFATADQLLAELRRKN